MNNDLLKRFKLLPFDLVLLDIEMPEIDGISLARRLRAISEEVHIVFLTSHIEYALDGYEVNALRYLTKPVDMQKLKEILDYISAKQNKEDALWIKTDDGEEKLKLSDVIYFEAQNQNVVIKCTHAQFDAFIENSGTSMIIATVLGTLFMFLFYLPRKTHHQLFIKNKKMTIGWFAVLLCVFMGVQLIIDPVFMGFEALLNLLGFSAMASMEAATASGETTLSMFIYGGIVAPVVEELLYRGFVMRALSKHGKTFAILASSILFGVMHGNIPQAMFATLTGIVLGYVAMEYSIIWSIILHTLNNMVFGELLTMALNNTNELTANIVWYSLIGVMFAIGLIAIIIKRKQIMAYIKENKWNKPYMRWTFTTVLMLLFVLVNLGLGLMMIERI